MERIFIELKYTTSISFCAVCVPLGGARSVLCISLDSVQFTTAVDPLHARENKPSQGFILTHCMHVSLGFLSKCNSSHHGYSVV